MNVDNQQPDISAQPPEVKSRKGIWILVGSVCIAVAVGVGVVIGTGGQDANEAVGEAIGKRVVENAAAAVPGAAAASSAAATQSELNSSVVESQARFDAAKDSLPPKIDAELVRLGWGDYNIKTSPIEASSDGMSAQAILDRSFAEGVWAQTNPDKAQARADSDLIAVPESDVHQAIITSINNGTVQADPRLVIKSVRFDSGKFSQGGLSVDSTGLPTQIVASMGIFTKENLIEVYQFQKTADGQHHEWRELQAVTEDTPEWIDPASLSQASVTQGG